MSFLTLDVSKLRERWMKLYLNLFAMKSHSTEITEHLENFKEPLALFNEKMMTFFDKLEEYMAYKPECETCKIAKDNLPICQKMRKDAGMKEKW